jgi:hypothetical protein
MHLATRLFILSLALCGCSTDRSTAAVVTERDARLILSARRTAASEGFSLVDAVYQVRPDGEGWIVQVDRAPGYNGTGELSVVIDATFFVKFDSTEKVTEILSHGRQVKPASRPADGA